MISRIDKLEANSRSSSPILDTHHKAFKLLQATPSRVEEVRSRVAGSSNSEWIRSFAKTTEHVARAWCKVISSLVRVGRVSRVADQRKPVVTRR